MPCTRKQGIVHQVPHSLASSIVEMASASKWLVSCQAPRASDLTLKACSCSPVNRSRRPIKPSIYLPLERPLKLATHQSTVEKKSLEPNISQASSERNSSMRRPISLDSFQTFATAARS